GQLGEVADSHEHLRLRPSSADLCVSLERRHEPKANGLENRIDEVRYAERLEAGEGRLQRIESTTQIGNRHHACAGAGKVTGYLEIRTVNAEHELGARIDCRSYLRSVEAVDADPHARGAQLGDRPGETWKRQTRRAPQVYDVGSRRSVVLRHAPNLVRRQARRVVDLGEHL